MLKTLFNWACNEIETAEKSLGHTLSWRFLTTPAATFSADTNIVFLALNPGGNRIPANHPRRSSEIGSAYIYESWKSTALQHQVKTMFKEISTAIGNKDHMRMMNQSLMAYYIPFRSPSLKNLLRKKDSRRFAFQLWSNILGKLNPKLILAIDRLTYKDICRIIKRKPDTQKIDSQKFQTGWGKCSADVQMYSVPDSKILTITRFPHLSRFKIFDRPESDKYVRSIISAMTSHMT